MEEEGGEGGGRERAAEGKPGGTQRKLCLAIATPRAKQEKISHLSDTERFE